MKLTLVGVPPYDGTYELNLDRMTNREIHTIKKLSGYTPVEYTEAGQRGDTDLMVGLAVVALKRAGHVMVNEELIWEADAGAITFDVSDEQDDIANPQPPSAAKPSESIESSGTPSNGDSATLPESSPDSTGGQISDTSVGSPPMRSVS